MTLESSTSQIVSDLMMVVRSMSATEGAPSIHIDRALAQVLGQQIDECPKYTKTLSGATLFVSDLGSLLGKQVMPNLSECRVTDPNKLPSAVIATAILSL